jgi:hypothetical protein
VAVAVRRRIGIDVLVPGQAAVLIQGEVGEVVETHLHLEAVLVRVEGEDLVDPQLARIGLGEGQRSRVRASRHVDRSAVRLVEPVHGDIYGRVGEGDGQRSRHPIRDMDELDEFRSAVGFGRSPADKAIEEIDEVLFVREGRLVVF